MTTIRMILVSEPDLEVATATMSPDGKVTYTGVSDTLQSVVQEALRGKDDKRAAFDRLATEGWSNAYLMIALPEVIPAA